ncbi:PAS domain S-box protein [Undibacterium sp.]|uniref:PAS domain S-box protein n=1 Tax=Undibacterium sp. TaxID=1914977 RepID=UPI00351CCAC1
MSVLQSSLSNRLAAYFATLFLCSIGILFSLWYFGLPQLGLIGASNQRILEAMRILEAKADLQHTLIEKGIKNRRGDILAIAESRSLSTQLLNQDPAVQQNVERLFDRTQQGHPDRFQHLLIVDPLTGRIRASDVPADIGRSFDDPMLIKRAIQPGAAEVVEQLAGRDGAPALAIVRQIHAPESSDSPNRRLVGILIAYVDLQQFISEGFQEEKPGINNHRTTLLFDAAENVLARFPSAAPGTETFKLKHKMAAGFEGTLLEPNTNGDVLVVVYRHVQLSGSQAWTLVHYSSKADALGGLKESVNKLIIIGLLLTFAGLLLINLVARRLTRPLHALSETARQLGTGNLSARAAGHAGASREITALSDAFNRMAEGIQKDHNTLEAKVIERTTELQQSETRHRTLFEATPDALLVLAENVVIDCNPAALRLFGVAKHEDLLGKNISQLSPASQINGEDSQLAANRLIKQAMQEGMLAFEWLHKRVDTGQSFVAEVLLSRILIDGQVLMQGTIRDISARKFAEEQLRISEQNLAITLQSIGDAVIATDAAGLITRMNPTAERLTGWLLADAIGKALPGVFHIINTQTREREINPVQLVMEHGKVMDLAPHTSLLARDGQEYQISDSAAPIRNPAGQIIGVVLVFSDVTEDYRVRAALEKTAEMLARTGEIAKVGGWELDLQTMQLFWSLETCHIHEIDPPVTPTLEQALNFFTPEAQPVIQAAMQAAMNDGIPFDLELPKITAKGRPICVQTQGSAVIQDGKTIKLVGAFHDITERKRAQMALQESEERHRAMVEWTPEAIIIHRIDKIMYVNPAAIKLFGAHSEQDLVGKSLLGLIHPDFHQLALTQAKTITKHGVSTPMQEEVLIKLDGSLIVAEVQSTSIIYDEEPAFHTFIHDITKRKRILAALQESEERHRALVEWSPEGIFIHRDKKLIYVNPSTIKMLGANSAQDLLGKSVLDIISSDFHPLVPEQVGSILEHGSPAPMTEMKFRKLDGTLIDVETQGTSIEFDGAPASYVAWNDISKRKKNEEAQRIAATAFESQECMFVTDAQRVILQVNKAFSEITGYCAEEVVGRTPELLNSTRHDGAFYAAMMESITQTGSWQGEIWNRRKNGEDFPGWLTVTAVKDETGRMTHYVGTFTDITSRKTAEEKIKSLAFYDPLTNLPNRRLLRDRLEQVLAAASRHQRKGALLFVDLDNFKTLNDTLGHDKGDLLLQQVAERLHTCTRDGDTVARLGGDEFVVMLEDLSENALDAANQAEAVGEKILSALNQTYYLGSYEHHSTPSIGVTLFGEQPETIDEPLKRADLAMYQAKAAGRNTLRFFDPQMQAVVTARAALEEGLREAIAKNQFTLYYQAQVTGTDQLTGAEALLRWLHPERGMISPAEFIPLAEETGLILPLGHWVLNTACTQLAIWSRQPEMSRLTIAVNVSPRQFLQHGFVDQVLTVLQLTGARPQLLKLELTESLLVSNIEDVIMKMRALKSEGVGFSLDDFGTGYSSLSYLKQLPLDQLKIDQGFVRDILIDPNDAAIARMVIVLAESLGLAVIAEGVETKEQRDYLANQGCHSYQGYLFSRPVPLQEFEQLSKKLQVTAYRH